MIDLLGYGAFFLSMALTYAIICLGLNVQWGQTGLFNVGVAGFVAIGAYASALLTTPDAPDRLGGFGLPIFAGWIGAALAAGLASLLVGALTVRLQATTRTFALGLPFDVVIRLREEAETTLVDLRVASRFGPHDLGIGAEIAEHYMHALDAELLGIAGD